MTSPLRPLMILVAERLLARCDAVLRIGGPSAGADRMVAQARAQGAHVYTSLTDIPAAAGPTGAAVHLTTHNPAAPG